MLGQLVPTGGGDNIPLLKPKLLVGRRSRCDITLRFQNVSSHHCELSLENGYWRIQDLGSANGVKVNDERCDSKWLMPGDVVTIAKHSYEIQYTPTGDAPPPEEDVMQRSLMEKAGLERPMRRPRRDEPKLPPSAAPRKTSQPSDPDEDDAMRWLAEE
jgi:adenylate cyclase